MSWAEVAQESPRQGQWRCVLGQWMSWAEVAQKASTAKVINVRGSLDRLRRRGGFSIVDRSESGSAACTGKSNQNGNPMRTAVLIDGVGGGLGWAVTA